MPKDMLKRTIETVDERGGRHHVVNDKWINEGFPEKYSVVIEYAGGETKSAARNAADIVSPSPITVMIVDRENGGRPVSKKRFKPKSRVNSISDEFICRVRDWLEVTRVEQTENEV